MCIRDRVESGTIAVNQELTLLNHHDPDKKQKVKISKLYEFDGLNKVEVKDCLLYTSGTALLKLWGKKMYQLGGTSQIGIQVKIHLHAPLCRLVK